VWEERREHPVGGRQDLLVRNEKDIHISVPASRLLLSEGSGMSFPGQVQGYKRKKRKKRKSGMPIL
jgi:hypothetical protein